MPITNNAAEVMRTSFVDTVSRTRSRGRRNNGGVRNVRIRVWAAKPTLYVTAKPSPPAIINTGNTPSVCHRFASGVKLSSVTVSENPALQNALTE